MRKRKAQTKLSRTTSHRKALLKNLSQELIRHGKIRTTLAKAKALRPFVEPIINRAKSDSAHSQQLLANVLFDRDVVKILIEKVGPRYTSENRQGGYTRIIKLGQRQGDGAEEAIILLVEAKAESSKDEETKGKSSTKKGRVKNEN
ncbi:50S ribosomal protein L17 [candidate division WWE3 bacterium]|nr:50S ribosomal protein L17 [candidate division WWE3 bacterium]